MPDLRRKTAVTALSPAAWQRACERTGAPLPFAELSWIGLGLTGGTARRFTPVAVDWEDAGELLVPLCTDEESAQIGCFGYGQVWPSGEWRQDRLPDFPSLARVLAGAAGRARIGTLLPPAGAAPALDSLVEHWHGDEGRDTYVLDISGGADAVWAAARGSSRTAVRRAEALGLTARAGRPGDAARLLDLHRGTMARNDVHSAYDEDQFGFLLSGPGSGALTILAEDADGAHAATVFAVGRHTAYHIMQLTSDHGRRTNAGHLALREAVSALAAAGIRVLDLGCAANEGQERFKANWGAVARPSRVLEWKEADR